ncbi:MAG: hypothetical protein AAGD14_17750 [Planctomycetota bacterium]
MGRSGGRSATSVLNNPEFRVEWRDVTRVSKALTSGMTQAEAESIKAHERPMLVYVYNDERDEETRFAIEEANAFLDEKVAVGARFFDCVRIDLATAKEDAKLKDHLPRNNGLLFVRPNYEVAHAIHFKGTKVKPSAVYAKMCATMKLDYENCVKKTYKEMRKIQKDRAKLDRESNEVMKLDDKILNEKSNAKREKLIGKRDKLRKALDE